MTLYLVALLITGSASQVLAIPADASSPVWAMWVGGTRPHDYRFVKRNSAGETWVEARYGASRGPGDYGALLYTTSQADWAWGRRVRLSARFAVAQLDGGAWAGMFVRVDAAHGRVLAFDNMSQRPITGSSGSLSPPVFDPQSGRLIRAEYAYHAVVLDVPGAVDEQSTSCPAPELLPVSISVGLFLCGGRGMFWVRDVRFELVGPDVAVTGGPPPWMGPGLLDA